jgi:hypothetical protein
MKCDNPLPHPSLYIYSAIQKKRSVFWEIIVSEVLRKKVHVNICRFLKGYWDWTLWIWLTLFVRYLFMGLDKDWSLQKKGGYARRIAGWHSGCCDPHKGAWRSPGTKKKTPSSHTSGEVHWSWRWDFSNICCELWQICHLCVINLLSKHYVTIEIKFAVRNWLPFTLLFFLSCRFKELSPGNLSELDTHPYELLSQWLVP